MSNPNIVFILADQLRADTLGYAGDPKAITPNLDQFARHSLNLTDAVSVMPVCTAYRSSLFTGKFPSSTGMVINEINMNPNHRTIAHVLSDSGYDLGYVGKWHLNDRHQRPTPRGAERLGFDGFWAACSFNHQSYDSYYYTDGDDGELTRVSLEDRYGPEAFTSLPMTYIDHAVKEDKPFELFLSWNPPHDPWTRDNVPRENYARFADTTFTLPGNFDERPDPYMDRYPDLAFEGETKWKKTFIDDGLQECLRCYYAMINSLDEQFGRITAQLNQLGIDENTIIVFTSDHGEMFGSHGRMFKLTFYDEAARVPFLIRYPGKINSRESDICFNTPDIMPTLLGLAGLGDRVPGEVEGMDLTHVMRGKPGKEPTAAFLQGLGHTYQWKDGSEWRAVRDKHFTYAKYLRDGKELLFDRRDDPLCIKNVAKNSRYARELSRLQAFMKMTMSGLNDSFKPCTWYRDNWMHKDYSVKAAARGTLGPLPPVEPQRASVIVPSHPYSSYRQGCTP